MKRKLAMAGALFSGVMLFFVFMLMSQGAAHQEMITTNLCFYSLLLGVCAYRLYRGEAYFEKNKERNKEIKDQQWQRKQQAKDKAEREKIEQRLKDGKTTADFKGQIIAGLPVPEGTVFNLKMKAAGVQFKVNEDTIYFIPMNRVTNAQSILKKDVVQIMKSNLGKAALDGFLFGDVGFILGGMPESQFRDALTKIYLLAYKTKEGIDNTLAFIAEDEWEADHFIRQIQLLKPTAEDSKVIEL